ncbi:helix-turn-helix domain-containing protein [Vibrio sp. MEBiC08052]|uniref:helix-turn-helix domain-containing protein n=1 Tax=Vibrio sp. MEBiC08052 TaxID=1761910 RepID=UPI0007406A16|nr:S24 family peptidase [Vibrio sp. MEBiC08052]KUI98645.1 hypothetical protein VRK_19750 [Vibrio sp. MEBiC08052]
METLSERLKARRLERGLTQDRLIEEIKRLYPQVDSLSRMTISNLETGMQKSVKDLMLLALSKVLNCNAEWLVCGTGEKEPPCATAISQPLNVEGKTHLQYCPVQSWEQLHSFIQAPDATISETTQFLLCPLPTGPRTFVLKVRGEAMAPRFKEGDWLFIDLDQIEPAHNQFVISRHDGEYTFKQFQSIEGRNFLKVSNPDYPPALRYVEITGSHTIIGTVITTVSSL